MKAAANQRTCDKGHVYYKSSSCPVCPICAQQQKPDSGILAALAAPAPRALLSAGITHAKQLCTYTEAELRALHGMGPNALQKIAVMLDSMGLQLKQESGHPNK